MKNLPDGTFDINELESCIRPLADLYQPLSGLIVVENTHTCCGGKIVNPEFLSKVSSRPKLQSTYANLHEMICCLRLIYCRVSSCGVLIWNSYWFSFYPRDAMLARVIEIATCLSVHLSRAGIVSKRRKLAA